MNHERLNEHDANQGAQSKGEFLGMTGNTAWYLLGAAGASVLLIIVLWGVLGFPLLVCLGLSAVLCALSVGYVFALKNNKPAHYDSDFFEATLVEAGILARAFGPRAQRPPNPFRVASVVTNSDGARDEEREPTPARRHSASVNSSPSENRAAVAIAAKPREKPRRELEEMRTVPLADYERLRDELDSAGEELEGALVAHEEEGA